MYMQGGAVSTHARTSAYTRRQAHGGGWYLAHDTAVIHEEALIWADAEIGERVRIGEGVHIGERSHIGERVRIGEKSHIGKVVRIGERAVIGRGSHIGKTARIDEHSVIGERARIDEGARIGERAVIGRRSHIGKHSAVGGWAVIGEHGRGYVHCLLLGYRADAYRTSDDRLWLRYGCVARPVTEWREQLAELCRQHEPQRAAEYERALRGLLDCVESLVLEDQGEERTYTMEAP